MNTLIRCRLLLILLCNEYFYSEQSNESFKEIVVGKYFGFKILGTYSYALLEKFRMMLLVQIMMHKNKQIYISWELVEYNNVYTLNLLLVKNV